MPHLPCAVTPPLGHRCSLVLAVLWGAVTPLLCQADPWQRSPDTGHYLSKTPATAWENAEYISAGVGGHLVTVRDANQQSWLHTTFGGEVWIGLNDIAQEGRFEWSSGEAEAFRDWGPGRPVATNDGYDAVKLTTALQGRWSDWPVGASLPGIVELVDDPVVDVSWTMLGLPNGPGARTAGALAGATGLGGPARVLLFGGRTAAGVVGDTWELNGATWSRRFPVLNPAAREAAGMAYDAARGITWMYGGRNPGGVLADLWGWNGAQWTLATNGVGPGAREGAVLVFDAARDELLLIGGTNGNATYADTWSFRGQQWVRKGCASCPGGVQPPRRRNAAAAYDPLQGTVMLAGGEYQGRQLDDVWQWDGRTWRDITPTDGSDIRVSEHAMAFDPVAERIVLFGGRTLGMRWSLVWSWNGTGWDLHDPLAVGAAARVGHGMTFDATSRQLLVFGGEASDGTLLQDAWQVRVPVFARSQAFGAGCAGVGVPAPSLVVEPGERAVLGSTFRLRMTDLPPGILSIPYGQIGFSRTQWAGGSLPFDLSGVGMPGCDLLMSGEAVVILRSVQGQAAWGLDIPSDGATFLGVEIYLQGAVLAPRANPLGVLVTNAVEVRIGNA